MISHSLFSVGVLALLAIPSVDASYLKYDTVPGYFLQDDDTTETDGFDYTATNFGLISQPYNSDASFDNSGTKTQWELFENQVAVLNANSGATERYVILYLGRHGEGYHNVAESYYGTPAWNCYWSELDGNGTTTWADAHITPNGVTQAQIAHDFWASQVDSQRQSLPESYYTSPMSRCLETAKLTFQGLVSPFKPLIKELLREGISMHTCDHRSSKSYIAANYPGWPFEAGFSENDELWTGTTAETPSAQDKRSKTALDSIFSTDSHRSFSLTSHSGEIASLLRVIGHREFRLSTGAVLPALVKIEEVEGSAPHTSVAPWEAQATCNAPPITSLKDVGCVCSSTTAAQSSATTADTSDTTASSTISTISTIYTTSVSTITKCPETVTDCPIGSVTTITYEHYITVCHVGEIPPFTTAPPYATANGTASLPQELSSPVVPTSQSSIITSSGATTQFGSGIALTAGLAVVGLWL